MGETRVTEWRCEGRGNADQEQRVKNAAGRKCRGSLLALRCREKEIDEASNGGERGLDCVQYQGVGKSLCWWLWFGGGWSANWVRSCGDCLLKNTP